MTEIFFDQKTRSFLLHRGKINFSATLDSFADLMGCVLQDLKGEEGLPKDAHKGWVPAKFLQDKRHKDGEIDEITSLVIDIDVADDFVGVPVQWDDVVARLPGVSLFGYTSYSSTPAKPRYRLVIETDRPMTRAEVRPMTAWVSWLACNRQADMSMADAAHYAIAPAHHAPTYFQAGKPMCVDATLALKARQELADPTDTYLRDYGYSRAKCPSKPSNPHPNAVITSLRASNPADWLSKDELASYANPPNGHWQTMYSLLKTAFYRSRGMLTFGDMQVVAAEIDSQAANYFQNKYTGRQLQERIKQAMSDADLASLNQNQPLRNLKLQAAPTPSVRPEVKPEVKPDLEYRQRINRLRAQVSLI